jgi:hypothetical protein
MKGKVSKKDDVKTAKVAKDGAVKVKKEKKPVEVTPITFKHPKAETAKEIHPATGSRFAPGTSKQIALDLIVSLVKAGKGAKEVRAALAEYRKENGKDRNLDAGYLAFCVASHPEYFECKSNGEIKLVKEFTPDPEAAKKLEEERAKRLAKKAERAAKGGKKVKGGKPVIKKAAKAADEADEAEDAEDAEDADEADEAEDAEDADEAEVEEADDANADDEDDDDDDEE